MLDQEGKCLVYRLRVEQVVVVENEDNKRRERGDLVQQRGEDRLELRRLRCAERGDDPRVKVRSDRQQGRSEVREEAGGVAVPLVEGQPRNAQLRVDPGETGDPFGKERGLAEAGRCGDEGQLAGEASVLPQARVEPVEQPGARDGAQPGLGNVQLGGHNGRGHRSIIKQAPQNSNSVRPRAARQGVRACAAESCE